VTIIAGDGQLEVRAQGIALQNGRIGDVIQIRNADSKKILMGRVTAAGVVQVSI
jgi:flagellar basal body P-ring formation protein FlgA